MICSLYKCLCEDYSKCSCPISVSSALLLCDSASLSKRAKPVRSVFNSCEMFHMWGCELYTINVSAFDAHKEVYVQVRCDAHSILPVHMLPPVVPAALFFINNGVCLHVVLSVLSLANKTSKPPTSAANKIRQASCEAG